jgi:hypothetical protein
VSLVAIPTLIACPSSPPPKVAAEDPSASASASATSSGARRDPKTTKAWLCECQHRLDPGGSCEEMGFEDPDEDCLRTYSDCTYVLGCLRGEPGAIPRCRPGYRNAGIGRCYKICSTDAQCSAEETCSNEWDAPTICMPK